jgi:integrase
MAIYRRKDSPVWWASYTDSSGKRVRRATGSTDKKEASALEAKWKLEAHKQKQWGAAPVYTFDELMLRYLKETEGTKRSASRDRTSARPLYRAFTGRELHSITAKDVRAYIEQRRQEVSPSSINRELSLLSVAFNHARVHWDWQLPTNPAQGRKLREPEGRLRWITHTEAAALIQAADALPRAQHLPEFITLALHTGCRSGELLGLEWRRVDLQRGLLLLEAEHTKAGRRRYVPINATARAVLLRLASYRASHCPASPWVFCNKDGGRVKSVRTAWARACKAAGLQDFRVHDLRHTAAAWLVTAGVPIMEVRELLGHSTVLVTERYAHLAPENVRAAVAKLDHVSRFGHVEPQPEPDKRPNTA